MRGGPSHRWVARREQGGGELTHQCEGFDPSHWWVAWGKAWNTYFAICMRRRHHVTSSGLGVGILHYIEREDLLGIAIM